MLKPDQELLSATQTCTKGDVGGGGEEGLKKMEGGVGVAISSPPATLGFRLVLFY